MQKSVFLTIFTSFILSMSSGCLFIDQGTGQETSDAVQVNTDNKNLDDLDKNDSNKIVEYHSQRDIKEFSRLLRLDPLMRTAQAEGFEFRLWINLGMPGDEKLFRIRSSGGNSYAYFNHLRRVVDPTSFRQKPLSSPKSGWNSVVTEIGSRIDTPTRLALDPKFDLSRHEGVIWLEFVEKGKYQVVYYGHHTSFGDGVRLINLCKYLSDEFGVDTDCRGERTRLGPIK